MKRIFTVLLSTSIIMMLASCDKSSYPPIDDDTSPIGLSIDLNNDSFKPNYLTTKGAEITNLNMTDFGIYAYLDEDGSFDNTASTPNFMSNVKAQKISGNWDYSPLRYWPRDGVVSFFAYAPYSATTGGHLNVSTIGQPTYTFTQPTDVKSHLDLLLAYPQVDKTKSSLPEDEKLPLKFKHALSSVIFKASVLSEMNTSVEIRSITIQSIKNRGTASFISDAISPDGWRLDWSGVPTSTDVDYVLNRDNGCLLNTDLKSQTTPITINADDGVVILLPQNVDDTDKMIVKIFRYGEEMTVEKNIKDLSITEFETGKRYVVDIMILPIVEVKITCTVQDWTNKVIDVPPFE